jgi:cell division protein FtsZ
MSINLTVPQATELKPRITVFGVGGAGGNAVNNMIDSGLEGVEFVVANTDAQSLAMASAEHRIQLGEAITQGLGAGSRPEVGCAAAEEALGEISESLEDSHMVFITAGMGGGTGTGAAPVIARTAREKGILTVGVVTKPFQFEGARRARLADEGITELSKFVDTLIIIPNQNLFRIANERTTFAEAFSMADEVLHSGVAGITDLMVKPGLINLDFADVRTVMNEMGKAMMGTGEAEGEKRAVEAAEAAISNPLLDEVSMKGARGVLINITGGMDLTLYEVDEAANRIRSEVDPEANIIVGSTFDSSLDGKMRVSVVATGIDVDQAELPRPETEKITMLRPGRRMSTEETAAEASAAENVAQAEPVEAAEPEMVPVETELALEAPLPADFDPASYEAEVIIHKPEPIAEAEPVQPVLSADPEPNRPFIPAGLNRVEARSSELPSFLGTRPEPVARQPIPARGPSLFERLTGRSKSAPEPRQAPVVAREDVQPAPPVRQPAAQQAPALEAQQPAPREQAPTPKPEDGMVASSFEEDQLEIPTFLRRQAN